VRTKRATERLADKLKRQGMNVSVLHGDRTQSQRNSALSAFQQGKSRVLVATDVASRGIHVDDIAQVINYDLPAIPEDFIHRVGRTGRAGATGAAATFYSGAERSDLARLERTLQLKMRRGHVDSGLTREERAVPVDVSQFVPVPVKPGSRMVCLPGEVLQRYNGEGGFSGADARCVSNSTRRHKVPPACSHARLHSWQKQPNARVR